MQDVCIYSITNEAGILTGFRCGCGKIRKNFSGWKMAYAALMKHAKDCTPHPEERSEGDAWASKHFNVKR